MCFVCCFATPKKINSPQVELEVEKNVLTTKVNLTDGSTGHIFSRNPGRNDARLFTYNCHICSVPNLPGERCLYTHISGRRHQQRLANQPFNANLFRAPLHRSNKSMLSLSILLYESPPKTNSISIFSFTVLNSLLRLLQCSHLFEPRAESTSSCNGNCTRRTGTTRFRR